MSLRLDRDRARLLVRAIGASGTVVGLGSIAIPRQGLRLVGVEAEGRGVGFMSRLFGCRDVAICGTLVAQSFRSEPELSWLDMLAVSQVGDIALTTWLFRRGELSRRALAVVLATAPPTLLAAVAARVALGQPSAASGTGSGSTGARPTL